MDHIFWIDDPPHAGRMGATGFRQSHLLLHHPTQGRTLSQEVPLRGRFRATLSRYHRVLLLHLLEGQGV